MSAVLKLANPRRAEKTLADGSMVVSEEQLRQIGNGNLSRGRHQLRVLLGIDQQKESSVYNTAPDICPAAVRLATEKDEQPILDLLLLDLAENAAHIAPIDEERVLEKICQGTRRQGGLTAVIDGPDGKPVAVVILELARWWWSNGTYWFETVAFVHPDHRKSRHIDDLLDFEKWAAAGMTKRMGHTFYLINGVLGAWRIMTKIALYRRKFSQQGAAFCFPPPPTRGN